MDNKDYTAQNVLTKRVFDGALYVDGSCTEIANASAHEHFPSKQVPNPMPNDKLQAPPTSSNTEYVPNLHV